MRRFRFSSTWAVPTCPNPGMIRTLPGVAILLLTVLTAPVGAATLITVDEALAAAFPEATVERESLFLTEEQVAEVLERSGGDEQSGLVSRYLARRDGAVVGYAYLDTHRVRTLPETLLVVVAPDATVRRVEVVTFREPTDYLPPRGWYEQLEGRPLDDELQLKRGIRPITGATLTARATTEAVRRILAVHAVTSPGADE